MSLVTYHFDFSVSLLVSGVFQVIQRKKMPLQESGHPYNRWESHSAALRWCARLHCMKPAQTTRLARHMSEHDEFPTDQLPPQKSFGLVKCRLASRLPLMHGNLTPANHDCDNDEHDDFWFLFSILGHFIWMWKNYIWVPCKSQKVINLNEDVFCAAFNILLFVVLIITHLP